MKKYSIFKQIIKIRKEHFCFRDKAFIFEQISDVAQQVDKAFLFGKSSDSAKIRTTGINYNGTVAIFTEVVNNDFGTSAFVNMEESNIWIGEYLEPVKLPAGFIDMYKWKSRQRLFQSLVPRSSFSGKLMVKSDQRSRYDFQSAEVLQYLLRTVIGSFSLITDKSGFSSGIRSNKGVGNFLIPPVMDNVFTITTPIVAMNKASRSKFGVFKIFLNMFSSMVAGRNVFTAAQWESIKVNINGFINSLRFDSKTAEISYRSTRFFRGESFFSLIFFKRSLKRFGKILFKLGFIIFKFPDTFLKLNSLPVGNIHGKSKFINTVSLVIAIAKKRFRSFAIKKNTKVLEGTVGNFAFPGMERCFAIFHGVLYKSVSHKPVTNTLEKISINVNNFFKVNCILYRK